VESQGRALRIRPRLAVAVVAGLAVLAAVIAAVIAVGPWAAATASAQSGTNPRSWVSGVGDDFNPCSRTAPCKTFAGAISKTAPGGEIDVLDPGSFGTVTITHSISIESHGEFAGVLNARTNGIVVKAGPNDNVVLRGLTIDGQGTGVNGIRFLSGGTLMVEDTTINNETVDGIDFEPSGASKLFVVDSKIRNNGGASSFGILLKPGAAGSAKGAIDNVRLTNNTVGLEVSTGGKATVNATVAASNGIGFDAEAGGVATKLALTGGLATDNSGGAVVANGTKATVTIAGVSIANNLAGLSATNGAQILSFGTNPDSDSGAPTGSLPLK
jgi:hypothetical protein